MYLFGDLDHATLREQEAIYLRRGCDAEALARGEIDPMLRKTHNDRADICAGMLAHIRRTIARRSRA
jgi:hypothetical protein